MNPATQAPKYGKIELIMLNGETISHEDCGMFITGDRLVIVMNRQDSIQNTQISEGIIYDLSQVERYTTYQQ